MKITPWVFITGALFCFSAVLIGAFGAHAFEDLLVNNNRLATYETASQYHFFHAFTLLLLSLVDEPKHLNSTKVFLVWCFVCGTLIFSSTLYLLALTNFEFLGAITPIGGLVLLLAWLGMVRMGLQWNEKEKTN